MTKRYWLWYVTVMACIGASLGLTATMLWTFYTAFFHPSKQIIVDINHFGEANIEAVGFALIYIIAVVGFLRQTIKGKF